MTCSAPAILLPVLVVAACSARPTPPRETLGERLLQERIDWTQRFKAEQARVNWRNDRPRVYDSHDGTVIVRDWALLGQPDQDYLRVLFTYDNRTIHTFDRARVWVKVHEPNGVVAASRWEDLTMPWYDFAPGNTYTMAIRVPTDGAHWHEGWYWTVGSTAHRRVPIGVASLR